MIAPPEDSREGYDTRMAEDDDVKRNEDEERDNLIVGGNNEVVRRKKLDRGRRRLQVFLFSISALILGVTAGFLNKVSYQSASSKGKGTSLMNDTGGMLGGHSDTATAESQTSEPLRPLPPLSDLVKGEDIVGDVGWMLDFSIVDYPKCGTTFLMNYLRKHSGNEIYMNQGEICDIDRLHPERIVNKYYEQHSKNRQTPDGRTIVFGLKCPKELETEHGLRLYSKYFPHTKFIVSLRHPILWFQSYYNFRAYHHFPLRMPPTKQLIGPCEPNYGPYVPHNCSKLCPSGKQHVCTDRANFHHSLSRLGKTPMSTPEEMHLLRHSMEVISTKNKIFLMEDRQIIAENRASKHFTRDLQKFLGIKHKLRSLEPYVPLPHEIRYSNKEAAATTIDICNEEHDEVRSVLLRQGTEAAKWIREYFIQSPDVFVSFKKEFIGLLDDWGQDPCEDPHNRMLWSSMPFG